MHTLEPKDRTKREHLARVDRVVFSSDADDFVILSLDDGHTAVGPAPADAFGTRGIIFRFLGRWEDDPARGPRFRFSTFVTHSAHGRAGVVKYLTETCEGVGQRLAARLYDHYAGDAVATLRDHPERVAAECGIDPNVAACAAVELDRAKRFEATRIDLFTLLDRRGFHGKLIEHCIDKWGAKAPAVIRRNPFALLGLPSAGFKRCDRLWADLALPPASLKRQALCAWNALRNESQGHTWTPAERLADVLRELIPTADPLRAFKFAIRARRLKRHRDHAGRLWLAVYERATAEERVAAAVRRLSAAPCLWPTDRVPVSRADGDRLPSAHQVERLGLATAGPLGMLLGGPGTGKTHTLAYLLREVLAVSGRSSVAVVAPTGKAAVRATQALALAGLGDLAAKTIHSTLEIGRNGHDGDGWGFLRGPAFPLDCRFLVCDETSMVDATLMADLLDACGTGTHVLLIGDPYQLPPVGHGAPLRDLIDAGVPHGELTQVRRNAGQIVHACVRVKNGESFDTADKVDLDAEPPRNLRLVEARDPAHARDLLVELLKGMRRFDPVWQTQVIVARNQKGELSRKKLNELLHPLLNPDGYGVRENPFKVGDKVICLRNSRMHRVEPTGRFHPDYAAEMAREAGNYQVVKRDDGFGGTTREPEEVYVANGEIGRVVAVAKGLTVARFSEGEALVKIPMGNKGRDRDEEDEGGEGGGGGGGGGGDGERGRGCNFDHAYAVTCHKMQGSESPCVIVLADPEAGMIADRAWWYTAISRASKLCVLVGQRAWIDKQRLRQSLVRRKTFLAELVREVCDGPI